MASRREFLTASGAAVAAVAAPGAAGQERAEGFDPQLLEALAEAVLPEEIGPAGVQEATRDFRRWLAGFEPVAELPHPYLSSDEVRYGPADPAPRWASQLEALDLLSRKRHGTGFGALPPEARRALVARDLAGQLPDGRLPQPASASHLAVGLLARFYARPAAADLAYGARINAAACRDLAQGAVAPTPLPGA